MIDEKGNEKQHFSMLVDLIMDCDVDKLTMLWLVSNDKDFSKAVGKIEGQELPDIKNAVIPEYTFRFIMQDLYRFFTHSPLSSQLINPFKQEETLLDLPELAKFFSIEETVDCCKLLFELVHYKQTLSILDDVIKREGASASALLLKGQVLMWQKNYTEAINCGRSAEMLEPDNADILRFLFECYAWQGRHEEELEYLQKLAEIMPDNKSLPLLIACAIDKVGRHEEALQLFFKLDYELEEDNKDREKLASSIANTALTLDKLDIAERYTKKELDLSDSKKWEAHLRMGHIKLLEGDWKSALDSYGQFVNTFSKEFGQAANIALAKFMQSQEMLVQKGIKEEDILLIHDALQASADGTLKPDSTQATKG
jgi:tetratricopeptide (TPR) repeat protein